MSKASILSMLLAVGACLVGLVSLLGYTFGIEFMYRPLDDGAATHPLTAICTLASGIALLCDRKGYLCGRILAGLSLLICVIVLIPGFGDTLLNAITPFHSTVSHELSAGKSNSMGANTAVSLAFVALALLMRARANPRGAQSMAFIALFFPVTSITGYLYQLQNFYGEMSPITCVLLTALGAACLARTPDSWVMKVLLGSTGVSRVARMQLVASLIFPLIVGFIILYSNAKDVTHLFAMGIVSFMWFSVTLISFSMLRLQRFEDQLTDSIDKLEISEQRFRSLFEYAPIATVLVNEQDQIESSNRAASELFLYTREQLHDKKIDELVPDYWQAVATDSHNSSPIPENIHRSINRVEVQANYDRRIPVDISLSTITTEMGNPDQTHTLLTLADRTEAQHYLDSLERSNAELDQFAYIASHDLRAPLRAISNLAQFIAEDLDEHFTTDTRKYFDLLQNRVKRMDKLLTDLLEYSRIGRQASEADWLEIRGIIDNIKKMYVPEDKFDVTVLGEHPVVFAPLPQFELAARNLLMNSVKHHHKSHGQLTVWLVNSDAWIDVYFADDGPGIDEQYRQKVFEIFTTLKPRDEVEGSGMGLALVSKSMQTVGGDVSIVENPEGIPADLNAGVVFRLRYPSPLQKQHPPASTQTQG